MNNIDAERAERVKAVLDEPVNIIAMYMTLLSEILGRKIELADDMTVEVQVKALRKYWFYKYNYWYWKCGTLILFLICAFQYVWFTGGFDK